MTKIFVVVLCEQDGGTMSQHFSSSEILSAFFKAIFSWVLTIYQTCWILYIYCLFISQDHPCTWRKHSQRVSVLFCYFFLDQEFSLSVQDEDLFSLELATAHAERPFSQFSLLLRRPAPPWVSKMLCEPLWWWKWVGARSLRHIKLGKMLNVIIMERSRVVGCLQRSTWLWLGFNILVHVLGGAVE